jgi:flagellar hook-length control protein FliK
MIQLSSLPATGPETPAKAAVAAAPAGVFASLLEGELSGDDAASGKILPEGGKTLPDGLPADGEAACAPRIAMAQIAVAKAKGVASELAGNGIDKAKASTQAEAATDADEAQAEASGEAKADTAQAASTPIDLSQALLAAVPAAAIAVAAAVSQAQAQPQAEQAESDGASPQHGEKAAAQVPAAVAKLALASKATQAAGHDEGQAQANDPAAAQAAGAEVQAKPADKADAARSLRPAQEFRFELARDAKAATAGDLAGARTGQSATAPTLPGAPAVQAQLPDSLNAANATKAVADTAGTQQQGLRPHEFTALVDRLVEARETARGGSATVSVMHADFGEVSLRFSHDNGALSVAMSNQDPDFARAVHAATPADGSQTGEAPFQGGRRDDASQDASARAGADARASAGDSGSGRQGTDNTNDNQRGDRAEPQHRAAGQAGTTMGGIYA